MSNVVAINSAVADIEKEAKEELAKEAATKAKGQIKDSLKRVKAAEVVLANAQREHEVLMRTIGAE